jgi:hypothetical protein
MENRPEPVAPVAPARRKVASPPPAPAPAQAPPPVETSMPAPSPALSLEDRAVAFPAEKDAAMSEKRATAVGELKQDEATQQATGNASMMRDPRAAAEQSRAPSPNSSIKLRQNMHLPPEDWLAEIRRLKREGRQQEAIENLRLFRRMHPDWKLSAELRQLAE